MKKVFAFVIGAALMLSATNAFAQLSFGAGWLNSTETTKYTSGDPDKTNLNGLYIGGQYNLNVVAGLGVAPGVYFSTLFDRRNNSEAIYGTFKNERETYREFAFNIPVNLNYTFELGRDFNLFVYAGPVFQIAFSSKGSYEASAGLGTFVQSTGKYTLNYFNGKVYGPDNKEVATLNEGGISNPFNIYLGGGVGIQAGDIQVIIGYDHSMMNFAKVKDTFTSRSQIKLGIGFSF
ncbi:MAG: hypothetical protein IJU21_01070 [Bacteroidales bacterium]|nr:hypothetical protein [Bacteroidales bacterium]